MNFKGELLHASDHLRGTISYINGSLGQLTRKAAACEAQQFA